MEFYNCTRVQVEGVLLTNSPMWDLGLRYDTDVEVEGLRVFNNANDPTGAPNTDGVDLVGSRDVRLSHLDIDTGDDDVAMKSGLPGIDPANPGVPTFAYYKPPYSLPKIPLSDVPYRAFDVQARARHVGRQRDRQWRQPHPRP